MAWLFFFYFTPLTVENIKKMYTNNIHVMPILCFSAFWRIFAVLHPKGKWNTWGPASCSMSDPHCNLVQVLALTSNKYSFMHSFSLNSDSFKVLGKHRWKQQKLMGKVYWQSLCLSLKGSCATHVMCVKYALSGVRMQLFRIHYFKIIFMAQANMVHNKKEFWPYCRDQTD